MKRMHGRMMGGHAMDELHRMHGVDVLHGDHGKMRRGAGNDQQAMIKAMREMTREMKAMRKEMKTLRKQVAKKAKPEHYPAPYALIEHWQKHYGNERKFLQHEAESVARLSTNDTTRNLVRVFLLQDAFGSSCC